MIKAPEVTNLRVALLSANHIHLKWDDAGSNFFYLVEYALTRDSAGELIPADRLAWQSIGITRDEQWYSDTLIQPDEHYIFRVATSYRDFERSNWVETEEILSFSQNAYYISAMEEFTPSKKFVEEKFVKNKAYIDFNKDNIQASLMGEQFVFNPEYEHLSNIKNFIVSDNNYHEVQHHIEPVCADINRVMLGEIDNVLYLFERFQNYIKVSNDKGQTWKYYKALTDRVGNPVSRTVLCQSTSATYVLGYDRIFYGSSSTDVRWSSDIEKFSDNLISFAKDNTSELIGFETEQFKSFALLPPTITKVAEAITCNDEYVYVAAKNKIRRIKLKQTPIDVDPDSPTFGQRLFEPEVINPTTNDLAVVKKMEVINEKLLVFVSGQVKQAGMDPTIKENVIPCDEVGIYMLNDDLTMTRVFGKDEYERSLLDHEYSNMSSNGKSVYVSSAHYKYQNSRKIDLEDPNVSHAVAYKTPPVYSASEAIYFNHYRTEDGLEWKSEPAEYYNEGDYTWMRRSGTRCWITNDNRPLVVYPETIYTKDTDTQSFSDGTRINAETNEVGKTVIHMNNVSFNGFKKYANGILFHREDGLLIGYYQLPYRVRDNVTIFWKPTNVMMIAELLQQEHDKDYEPAYQDPYQDPNISPLLVKMCPENYLEGNFNAFSKYYLEFISEGTTSAYNQLLNLIRNQYPREQDNFTYLWSEIRKRNIYIDKKKREEVVRFFEARSSDFYSTKGIEESYKFLFKLLYDEEVEIETESKMGLEYDITVYSDNISENIVGKTISTPTGRCNVTYLEREYKDGKLQWNITIHNMVGKFMEGQAIKSDTDGGTFTGTVIRGIRGKDIPTIGEYPDRGKTYYVMKIKSQIPLSRYKDDVIRFVHPAGFGFMGVTMITVLINYGLSMKHFETIVNIMKAYKWDAGYPSEYPDRVAKLDFYGNMSFNKYGEPMYDAHPKAGEPFPVPPEYDKEEKPMNGVLPSARRFKLSPLFDASTPAFNHFRNMVDKRMKDDNELPRDPKDPTQVKV